MEREANKFGARADPLSSVIELKDNTVIVVLGASGDLAKKKTVCVTARRKYSPMCQLANSSQFPALFGLVSWAAPRSLQPTNPPPTPTRDPDETND
jgi:hypothetical protein